MKTKDDIINERIILPLDFMGKRYTPSLLIKNFFIKLFINVYPDFENTILIKNIVFEQDKFRFILEDKSTQDKLDMYIYENVFNCNGIFCTNNLCFGIHDKINNKNLLKFLLFLKNKLNDLKFVNFLEILSKDPKAKKDYYQIFWKAKRPPFSIIQDWSHEIHKVRFIVPEGVFRNLEQSLKLNLSEGHIHHSEKECRAIGPEIDFHKEIHFFSYPNGFFNHTFDKYFYLNDTEKNLLNKKDISGISISTDLEEDDIVMGKGNDILLKAINNISDNIEKYGIKTLTFNCCCVPRIVGDDINSILDKAKNKIKIPFIFSGQLEKTPFEQKIELIDRYLLGINRNIIEKIPNSISLFGYHENLYLEKIYNILKLNNIKLNSIFIPTIDLELLHKLFETSLFVFSDNKLQEEIFEYPFKVLGVEYISPNYPYGINKTKKWFEDILIYFSKKYILSDFENELILKYNEKVIYIKEKGYRIGLIFVGKEQIENFFYASYNNNIDIVDFLKEMGFGIDFFIYDNLKDFFVVNNENKFQNSDIDHKILDSIILNKISTFENYSINYFSSEENLYKKIVEKNVNLVYSDIFYENRLYKYGINIFNTKVFKEGYEGAIDTISYLIKLIEINYYTDYGKYFK